MREREAMSRYVVPQRRGDEVSIDELPEEKDGYFIPSWFRRFPVQGEPISGTAYSRPHSDTETLVHSDSYSYSNSTFWADTDLSLIERLDRFLTGRLSYQDWEAEVSQWLTNSCPNPDIFQSVLSTAIHSLKRSSKNPWLFMLWPFFAQSTGTMNWISLSLGNHSTAAQSDSFVDGMLSELNHEIYAGYYDPQWLNDKKKCDNES